MSKSTVKRANDGTATCTVEFTTEEVSAAEVHAIARLSAKITVPGFRPGKAPIEKVRERIKASDITEEIIRELLPSTFEKLTKEENIVPIIHPDVQLQKTDPLTINVIFTEMPKVTIKGVDKIKVERKPIAVDAKEVQRMVDYILKQHEATTVVERAAKDGDKVTMNFYGEDMNGKEIENTRSTNYSTVIGSKSLIPGFEDALIGLKATEKKSFEVTFPEKYQAEHLRGQKAVFHVEILTVEEVHTPELTDEFCVQTLHTASKQAFLDEIESSMRAQEEDIERKRRESELLEKITDAVTVEIPDSLLNEEVRNLVSEFEQQLQRQKMNLQQWMEATQKTAEEVMENFKNNAKKRITLRLGIQQILKDKQIVVPESDITAAIDARKAMQPEQTEAIEKQLAPKTAAYEQLVWQLTVEKFMNDMLAK